MRAPVKIPGGPDVDQHKEVEERGGKEIHDRLRPAGPSGIDDVHPHMGPVEVGRAGDHDVVHGKQGQHQLMTPVRRHAEDIAHDDLKGDDRNADERSVSHHLADKDVGLLHGHHKGS